MGQVLPNSDLPGHANSCSLCHVTAQPPRSEKQALLQSLRALWLCRVFRAGPTLPWGVLAAVGAYCGAEFDQACPGPCSVRAGTLCWCC